MSTPVRSANTQAAQVSDNVVVLVGSDVAEVSRGEMPLLASWKGWDAKEGFRLDTAAPLKRRTNLRNPKLLTLRAEPF